MHALKRTRMSSPVRRNKQRAEATQKRSLPHRQQRTPRDAATQWASDDANGQPTSAAREHADIHLANLRDRTKQRAATAFDGRVFLVPAAAHDKRYLDWVNARQQPASRRPLCPLHTAPLCPFVYAAHALHRRPTQQHCPNYRPSSPRILHPNPQSPPSPSARFSFLKQHQ